MNLFRASGLTEGPSSHRVANRAAEQSRKICITAKKITTICLGLFATWATSNMPVAEAGPFAGGLYLLACLPLLEAPPLLAVCLAAAGVATVIPGP